MPTYSLAISDIQEINYLMTCSQKNHWNRIGELLSEGKWKSYISAAWDYKQTRLLDVMRLFNASLACLEEKGIKLFDILKTEQAKAYRKRFRPYFELAQTIKEQVETLKKQSSEFRTEFHTLECQLVGLRYRLGAATGGEDKLDEPNHTLLQELKKKALEWKAKQKLASDRTRLNTLEIEQLEEASKYPEWVALLGQEKKYDDDFFNWALRDYNRVDVFIAYRHTQKQIKEALLACSLGRIRKPGSFEPLDFEERKTKVEGIKKRILTMPIYEGRFDQFEADKQRRINILKSTEEVAFSAGHYTLTIRQIWEELARKNSRETRVNLCAGGLINWHPVYGSWNAERQEYEKPTLTTGNWTQHVPPADLISQEELERRYGDKIKDRKMFFKVSSTRQSLDLNALNSHGFLQIYIHLDKDQWRVLDVGFYAYRFQQGLWDGLKLFCATVKRVLCLLDQNGSYTHRQRGAFPLFPDTEKGQAILDRIYAIGNKNGVFQFSAKNCSYPIQSSMEKVLGKGVPNFFFMPVTQGRTGIGFLDAILAFLDRCPEFIRKWGIRLLSSSLGAHREMTTINENKKKSHATIHHFRKTIHIWNPSFLPYQIERDTKAKQGPFAEGELTWGNTEPRLFNT